MSQSWIKETFSNKSSTFNIIAVILISTYAFIITFSTVYMLLNVSKFDKETIAMVSANYLQLKEIILFILGMFAQKRIEETKETVKETA